MIVMKSVDAILDALALQRQRGENSLVVCIEPGLVEAAVNALREYRKMFAPLIPGKIDSATILAAHEKMREHTSAQQTVLVFVECKSVEEFREALERMPIRHSSEWRGLDDGHLEFVLR